MASSDNGDHARPAAGEEEPPTKQLKLSVEDYQIPSPLFPDTTESVAEDANRTITLENGGANLESALPEDGNDLGFRVEDAQLGALETGPSTREESRIAEDFVEGTKPEDVTSSGSGLPLVTQLDTSPMVIDGENVGLVGGVPIAQIGDQERVQLPEHRETKIASGSSVSVGDTAANGLHVSGASAGAPAAEGLGQSLPSDLGAGTSSVQRTKTSLCSYFRKKGCRHGAACRYAHGEEELQPRPDGSWDPTSERAKALLLQQSAALPAEGVAEGAVEVPAAPVNAPVSEGAEDSGANPLSKCIVHVPRAWSVDHFKKFLTENVSLYTYAALLCFALLCSGLLKLK